MTEQILLRMEGITKAFFGVPVLKGIDFDLHYGEVHVLLGENGAGKSTLMKILSGAYTADAGTLALDGQAVDLQGFNPRAAEDIGIATVYQHFHLIPHLSVAENLAMPMFTREGGAVRWKEVYAHADEALARIHYDIDPKTQVRHLPVSQKQMLEIAIALSKNAKVLILDEPTASLSRNETEILFEAIAEIKSRGIGIIYISHKLEELKQVGDRITILRDGEKIATLPSDGAEVDEIVRLMIGKELAQSQGVESLAIDQNLFRVEGLQSEQIASPISFSLRKKEILGITGLVGSGKTELAQAIFGVDKLTGGATFLDEREVRIDSPQKAVALGLGFLPEDRDADGLCLNLSVKDNISLALMSKLRGFFFDTAAEKRTVLESIRSMDVKTTGMSQQVQYLSGGNKQKVVFGKWLSAKCNLLILDEPTIGIDVGARKDIYDLIRDFVAENDERGVIFISSDMTEVLDVTDRILVMAGRRIVAELDPKQTTKQRILRYSLQANKAAE
ncbi:MAG: sugar ABC transporter ATP-binding protein [Caldilineales bacterium]|nr:sugar ABC transporter ATP-binding protein [Caldilineales bacterium]